jgi:hypothetical protein
MPHDLARVTDCTARGSRVRKVKHIIVSSSTCRTRVLMPVMTIENEVRRQATEGVAKTDVAIDQARGGDFNVDDIARLIVHRMLLLQETNYVCNLLLCNISLLL